MWLARSLSAGGRRASMWPGPPTRPRHSLGSGARASVPQLAVSVGDVAVPATLSIAGQVLRGVFTFESGTSASSGRVVKVAGSRIALSLGDGTHTFVSITGGTGQLVISSQGVAAVLTASNA